MFRRLAKFDGPIFEEAYKLGCGGGRVFIRDVNWVTYLECIFRRGLKKGGCINGILRYVIAF